MKDNSVPLKLVALLAVGEFHSGEQLGQARGMSRAAINKHIQTLKSWGLDVYTVTGKGYSLPAPVQLLDEAAILSHLHQPDLAVIPDFYQTAKSAFCVAEKDGVIAGTIGCKDPRNEHATPPTMFVAAEARGRAHSPAAQQLERRVAPAAAG